MYTYIEREREEERKLKQMCVCVCEREGERKREGESACVRVRVCVCESACVRVRVSVSRSGSGSESESEGASVTADLQEHLSGMLWKLAWEEEAIVHEDAYEYRTCSPQAVCSGSGKKSGLCPGSMGRSFAVSSCLSFATPLRPQKTATGPLAAPVPACLQSGLIDCRNCGDHFLPSLAGAECMKWRFSQREGLSWRDRGWVNESRARGSRVCRVYSGV